MTREDYIQNLLNAGFNVRFDYSYGIKEITIKKQDGTKANIQAVSTSKDEDLLKYLSAVVQVGDATEIETVC